MKWTKVLASFIAPLVAVLVVITIIVVALNLSNIATKHVDVTSTPITVTMVDVNTISMGGTEHDPVPTTAVAGYIYDQGIYLASTAKVTNCQPHIQVHAATISTTDVSIYYWTGSIFQLITFSQTSSTSIDGLLGPAISMDINTEQIIALLVVFNVSGSFDLNAWVEVS